MLFIRDYNTHKTLPRVRFSSSEAKAEESKYWVGEERGGGRAAKDPEDFPRLQAPLILPSFSQGQCFCFTAWRRAVYTNTEQTPYLNSNHIYFMFPEHLDTRNQNGHQNTKYYCKTHSKMLSKQTVHEILHFWSEPFWISSCSYWSWWKML